MAYPTNSNKYEISSGFSWMLKYIFPYLLLAFWGTGLYASLKEDIIIGQYLCGFAIVYILLITILTINRISAFVYLDQESKSIIAYNSTGGKRKEKKWAELISVYNFLNFYTVLKFRDGVKIRFRSKKYVPFLDEDDAKDMVDLLRKLAIKNRIQQVTPPLQNKG